MTAPNYSTLDGAKMLAAIVEDHWRALGVPVEVRIDGVQVKDRTEYIVRSDMVNGRPRNAGWLNFGRARNAHR